jgi:hypothetical protein
LFVQILLTFVFIICTTSPMFLGWIIIYEAPLKHRMQNFDALVVDETLGGSRLFAAIRARDGTWMSNRTHAIVFILLFILAIICTLVPMRNIGAVSNLGPLVHEVSRQETLTLAALHLSRELTAGDEALAMPQAELRTKAVMLEAELAAVRDAVALGGGFDISKGLIPGDEPQRVGVLFFTPCRHAAVPSVI